MSSGSTAHKFQLREKAQLMSTPEMDRTLARLAHEIVEKNSGGEDMAFVGIRRRGGPPAERFGPVASRIGKKNLSRCAPDQNFYLADLSPLSPRPPVKQTKIPF